jgi:hypothetical protein
MDDLEILKQMISPRALIELTEEYQKKIAVLYEPQEIDSIVTIRNMPEDAFVIKVDQFSAPNNVFNGSHGECKRADYVIISPEKKRIIYIEVKRTKDEWDSIVKQLMGAECFVKFCREIGKTFWHESGFLGDYDSRFVSIGHTGRSIPKRKSRIEKIAPVHDTPEEALKIDWPHYIQFNLLAG